MCNPTEYIISIYRMHVVNKGLFKDKTMADSIDALFNNNSKDILDALKPSIQKSFEKAIKGHLNKVFSKTPYEDLFAK